MLSLGAGVQSTAVLLMALQGEFKEKLDAAIFADTGWEPRAVYEHLTWLEGKASAEGLPVYRVSAGSLRQDMIDAVEGRKKRAAQPPLFVRNDRGEPGKLLRACTRDFKVRPIRKMIRKLLGVRKPLAGAVEQWMGISADEQRRVRVSNTYWMRNRYPLIEKQMTRRSCLLWLERHGFPEPPRSSCIGCPFHSDAYWREMKKWCPDEFADAVDFDHAIRRGVPRVRNEAYLHRSLLPLEMVDLRSSQDRGQMLLPGFEEECMGFCGV